MICKDNKIKQGITGRRNLVGFFMPENMKGMMINE